MTEKKEIRVYKLRFIVFMLLFTCLLFFFLMLMRRTFSSYVSDANIEITSNYAAYIFETERLNFNLETDGIIPSNNPYVYQFTVSILTISEKVTSICLTKYQFVRRPIYRLIIACITNKTIMRQVVKISSTV